MDVVQDLINRLKSSHVPKVRNISDQAEGLGTKARDPSGAPKVRDIPAWVKGPEYPGRAADSAVMRKPQPDDTAVVNGFTTVQHHQPVAIHSSHQAQSSTYQTIDRTHNLHKYAIGGSNLGRLGVAPIEMSAQSHPGSAGTRGRLIAAIDEFVLDAQARHMANLMRQGIVPR